jgi:hypothetical protein
MIGFQYLIRERKINITNFAKEIGVHQSTIFDWFRKEKVPKIHRKYIAKKFGVSEEYLIEKVNDIITYKKKETGFNKYEIRGIITVIYLEKRNGKILETLIDTEDLCKLIKLNYRWNAIWKQNTKSYYAKATVYRGIINGERQQDSYYLQRVLLDVTDTNIIVDHKDYDSLNNCKYNLRTTSVGLNDSHRSGANKNNKSTGIRNVTYVERDNIYVVQIMRKGERFRWVFPTDQFEEACEFAKNKRQELFGEFAGEG